MDSKDPSDSDYPEAPILAVPEREKNCCTEDVLLSRPSRWTLTRRTNASDGLHLCEVSRYPLSEHFTNVRPPTESGLEGNKLRSWRLALERPGSHPARQARNILTPV